MIPAQMLVAVKVEATGEQQCLARHSPMVAWFGPGFTLLLSAPCTVWGRALPFTPLRHSHSPPPPSAFLGSSMPACLLGRVPPALPLLGALLDGPQAAARHLPLTVAPAACCCQVCTQPSRGSAADAWEEVAGWGTGSRWWGRHQRAGVQGAGEQAGFATNPRFLQDVPFSAARHGGRWAGGGAARRAGLTGTAHALCHMQPCQVSMSHSPKRPEPGCSARKIAAQG